LNDATIYSCTIHPNALNYTQATFNVRVGHDLHLAAAVKAKELGISLNDFVRNAISTATPV
jgi:predicted HicB family RNase H-like nuclease